MTIIYSQKAGRNHTRYLQVVIAEDTATVTNWSDVGASQGVGRGSTAMSLEAARTIVREHLGWGYRRMR